MVVFVVFGVVDQFVVDFGNISFNGGENCNVFVIDINVVVGQFQNEDQEGVGFIFNLVVFYFQFLVFFYVGELDLFVIEVMFFEFFFQIGFVVLICVCCDVVICCFFGYVYVNYNVIVDGEKVFEDFNYIFIKGCFCCIMWFQCDFVLCKIGQGNVFIKNFDVVIDNKVFYDIFVVFGNILSCKVVQDENGNFKGYGFVYYEIDEVVVNVIKYVNGMFFNEKKVYVGYYIFKKDCQSKFEEMKVNFINVYVKNIFVEVIDEEFCEFFVKYGDVIFFFFVCFDEGKSCGFGFVNFIIYEVVFKVVEEFNGKDFCGQELYVGCVQKKYECEEEFCRFYEVVCQEKVNKY